MYTKNYISNFIVYTRYLNFLKLYALESKKNL